MRRAERRKPSDSSEESEGLRHSARLIRILFSKSSHFKKAWDMPTEINLEPTNCPLCASNSFKVYMKGKDQFCGVPGVFQLVRCIECRHIFMNPRPTAASIPDCYPVDYPPHRPEASGAPLSTTPDKPTRQPWYLSRWARAVPGLRKLYYWLTDTRGEFIPEITSDSARAVEVGCAGGKFLDALRTRGYKAQGVELMPEPVAAARQRGFEVYQGTLEQAAFPDATFEAAFAFMVLEHLQDPLGTLREFHRILKPNGWLEFSIPNTGSWEAWLFGRFWSDHELPRHLQHFTVNSIGKFLSKADFTEVRIIHQNGLWTVRQPGRRLQRMVSPIATWTNVQTLVLRTAPPVGLPQRGRSDQAAGSGFRFRATNGRGAKTRSIAVRDCARIPVAEFVRIRIAFCDPLKPRDFSEVHSRAWCCIATKPQRVDVHRFAVMN